jgi:hypothetical protein
MARKRRCDAGILVAGVASFPRKYSMITNSSSEKEKLEKWKKLLLKWLCEKFGEELRSVVWHEDEEYPHAHFFMVPDVRQDFTLDWSRVHPGMANKQGSQMHGESRAMNDKCYRAAMIRFQTEFYEEVSSKCGHDRYGPRRQRVSRLQRKMELEMEDRERRMIEDMTAEVEYAKKHAAQIVGQKLPKRIAAALQEREQLIAENAALRSLLEAATGRALP